MYIVTHAGLSAGQQTAQVAHALAEFARERGDEFCHWHETSNYIIPLQESSPVELEKLLEITMIRGLETVIFREPDRAHELTAITFIPHESVKTLLAQLPLAGKHFVERERPASATTNTINTPKKGVSISDAPATLEGALS